MRTVSVKTVQCFWTIQRVNPKSVFAVEAEVGETTVNVEGRQL